MIFIPPKYFRIEEFVPKTLFEQYKYSESRLWWALDYRMVWTSYALRKRYGKMVVNTWLWGGVHHERGLRLYGTQTGAAMSQHLFGRACDLVPIDFTAEDIRQDILKNQSKEEFKYITCIEKDVWWLHFDCRNWDGDILVVSP
jgi:hypothetical protein